MTSRLIDQLPPETADVVRKIAEAAGTDVDTVINVTWAISMMIDARDPAIALLFNRNRALPHGGSL